MSAPFQKKALAPGEVAPPPAEKWQLKQLKPRHREIIVRLVHHGQTKKQIAADIGITYEHFLVLTNSPLFKEEMQKEIEAREMTERQTRLNHLAGPAVEVVEQILTKGRAEFKVTDPDTGKEVINTVRVTGRVLVDLVNSLLDRTGHKPIEKRVETRIDLGASIIQAHDAAQADDDMDGEFDRMQSINVTATDVTEGSGVAREMYSQPTEEGSVVSATREVDADRDSEPSSPPPDQPTEIYGFDAEGRCERCRLTEANCNCPHRENPKAEYFD